MKYVFTKEDGIQFELEYPCFVKMQVIYPSFICCGPEDVECVLVYPEKEDEKQIYYNIGFDRYPAFETVQMEISKD